MSAVVKVLACGHVAVAGSPRVCEHLLGENDKQAFGLLTGVGVEFDLVCEECVDQPVLLVACEGCVERAELRLWSVRGKPEIRYQDAEVRGTWQTVPWGVVPLNERCVAPLPNGWLALTADGLVSLDGFVCEAPVLEEELEEPWIGVPGPALHTSADGRYAAVVHDFANLGAVLDLSSGEVVRWLDRDNMHTAEASPFPIAFLPGDRVVAATHVNRLDLVDLRTGELLTERETEFSEYHGRLTASPCGRWFVDSRWVWHPFGAPALVEVEEWLRAGGDPVGVTLTDRDHDWNRPVAWISSEVVALQGIGDRIERMVDGVELYEVPSGRRLGEFTGPAGLLWGHGGRLYTSNEDGFEVWDPSVGARIGFVQGFRPIAHRDGTFVELKNGQLNSFSVD